MNSHIKISLNTIILKYAFVYLYSILNGWVEKEKQHWQIQTLLGKHLNNLYFVNMPKAYGRGQFIANIQKTKLLSNLFRIDMEGYVKTISCCCQENFVHKITRSKAQLDRRLIYVYPKSYYTLNL